MTAAVPPSLDRYRQQLGAAIDRDRHRAPARRTRTRWAMAIVTPAGILAAGISAALAFSTGPGLSTADAAVLHGAESALSPPSGTVLHDAATVTLGDQAPSHYELWAQTDSPGAWKVTKGGKVEAWTGSTLETYDPKSDTVSSSGSDPGRQPVDIAADLRSLLTSGHARVTGTTTIDGVAAYVLTVSGLPSGWSPGAANGTYYVAKNTYRPLLVQTTIDCGPDANCPETVHFETYQYLPATAANLSLLNLAAQHPQGASAK